MLEPGKLLLSVEGDVVVLFLILVAIFRIIGKVFRVDVCVDPFAVANFFLVTKVDVLIGGDLDRWVLLGIFLLLGEIGGLGLGIGLGGAVLLGG